MEKETLKQILWIEIMGNSRYGWVIPILLFIGFVIGFIIGQI